MRDTALTLGLFAGLLVGLAVSGAAAAQTAPPAGDPPASADIRDGRRAADRYTFSPRGDAFVRLDHVTGEVSYCAPRAAGWACQAAPEERAALEKEIGRLQDANAELRRQLAARDPAAGAPEPREPGEPREPDLAPPPPSPDARLRLPSNEDLERAVDYARKVWRHMLDMLGDLQKDAREKI